MLLLYTLLIQCCRAAIQYDVINIGKDGIGAVGKLLVVITYHTADNDTLPLQHTLKHMKDLS
jgi:hypothetical protein